MYHNAIGLSNGIRVEIKVNVSGFGRHSSQRRATAEGTHKGCPYGKLHGVLFRFDAATAEGTHKGCPYRKVHGVLFRLDAAPAVGTHEGCPYGKLHGVLL